MRPASASEGRVQKVGFELGKGRAHAGDLHPSIGYLTKQQDALHRSHGRRREGAKLPREVVRECELVVDRSISRERLLTRLQYRNVE
jgi:hypothetical protein